MRPSGRRADELRNVTIETGVTKHAEGLGADPRG